MRRPTEDEEFYNDVNSWLQTLVRLLQDAVVTAISALLKKPMLSGFLTSVRDCF